MMLSISTLKIFI